MNGRIRYATTSFTDHRLCPPKLVYTGWSPTYASISHNIPSKSYPQVMGMSSSYRWPSLPRNPSRTPVSYISLRRTPVRSVPQGTAPFQARQYPRSKLPTCLPAIASSHATCRHPPCSSPGIKSKTRLCGNSCRSRSGAYGSWKSVKWYRLAAIDCLLLAVDDDAAKSRKPASSIEIVRRFHSYRLDQHDRARPISAHIGSYQ